MARICRGLRGYGRPARLRSDSQDERGGDLRKDAATRFNAVPRPKRKLSFHQKHALDALPRRIEKLQGVIAALEARLADSSFHARDAVGFARTIEQHSASRAELEAAENEWLELEMLREDVEGP